MFKSTEKNKHNKSLFISSVVATILVFIVMLIWTSAAEAEQCNFFSVFEGATGDDILRWINPVNVFSNMTLTTLGSSFFVSFIVALLLTVFYLVLLFFAPTFVFYSFSAFLVLTECFI